MIWSLYHKIISSPLIDHYFVSKSDKESWRSNQRAKAALFGVAGTRGLSETHMDKKRYARSVHRILMNEFSAQWFPDEIMIGMATGVDIICMNPRPGMELMSINVFRDRYSYSTRIDAPSYCADHRVVTTVKNTFKLSKIYTDELSDKKKEFLSELERLNNLGKLKRIKEDISITYIMNILGSISCKEEFEDLFCENIDSHYPTIEENIDNYEY